MAAAVVAAADPVVSLARRATVDRILDGLRDQKGFDLAPAAEGFQDGLLPLQPGGSPARTAALASIAELAADQAAIETQVGIASCRERVGQDGVSRGVRDFTKK